MRHILLILIILVGLSGSAFRGNHHDHGQWNGLRFLRHRNRKDFPKAARGGHRQGRSAQETCDDHDETGKTLSDAKIKEVVTYSGYTMGKIVREK